MKVLFLDDNPSLLQSTIEMLEDEQFEVLVASDSKEVFTFLRGEPLPKVCFFDVDLKKTEQHINGLDVAQEVKTMLPNISIVIFTNWSDESMYFNRAKDLGLEFVDRKLLSNKSWMLDKISSFILPITDLIVENEGRIVFFDEQNQTRHCAKNTDILCISSTQIVPLSGKSYSGTKIQFIGNREVDFKIAISKVLDNFEHSKIDISHLKEISKRCHIDLTQIKSIVGENTVLLNSGTEISISGADKNRILEYFKKVIQNEKPE